jgi:putative FmdB family regulatory protein
MPTYEFQCRKCSETFEITCVAADRELPHDCPYCGKRGACRVFSAVTHKWQQKIGGQSLAEIKSLNEQSKKRWDDMQ